MSRFELKHTEDKDELIREWELLRDCINTKSEEGSAVHKLLQNDYAFPATVHPFNAYSLLMFFKNRKPMRVRETNSQSISPSRTDRWLKLWAETGTGTLNIRTSRFEGLNELWPARRSINGEPYFTYFEGYYGNNNLWENVCEVRKEKQNVPNRIVDWFELRNFAQILNDIVVSNGVSDPRRRNFKFTTWKDGELYSKIERHEGEEVMEGPPGWKMQQNGYVPTRDRVSQV